MHKDHANYRSWLVNPRLLLLPLGLVAVAQLHCGPIEPGHSELSTAGYSQAILTAVGEEMMLPRDKVPRGHYGAIVVAAASGNRVVSVQPDSATAHIEVLDVATGKLLLSPAVRAYTTGPERSLSAAISANGQMLVFGGWVGSRNLEAFDIGIESPSPSWKQLWPPIDSGGWCRADQFGYSIALSADGSRLVASCPGFSFYSSSGPLIFFHRQVAPDGKASYVLVGHMDAPSSDYFFGERMALSGNGKTLLVSGRTQDSLSGAVRGHVHTIELSDSFSIGRITVLEANDAQDNDEFGQALAISDDGLTALIGAKNHRDSTSMTLLGAAYVFGREYTGYDLEQKSKLVAPDGEGRAFGASVALSGDGMRALIGAPLDGHPSQFGAAYLWQIAGTSWAYQSKIVAATRQGGSEFGASVSLGGSGERAIIGARSYQYSGKSQAGAIYSYLLRRTLGDTCSSNAECASGFCADGVCCDQACGRSDDRDCQVCSKAKGATADGRCTLRSSATVCRSAKGNCDEAERCTGTSPDCPLDQFAPNTTVCRPKAGDCDRAEYCTGASVTCPSVDVKYPAGQVCRNAVGPCDAEELCNGTDNDCPADIKKPATTVCRAALGKCDEAERCNGSDSACPNDEFVPKGVLCGGGTHPTCDPGDRCNGAGTCSDNRAANKTPCKLSTGDAGQCNKVTRTCEP